MKILQIVPYFYPAWSYGGPAKLVFDTSCYFAEKGHLVTVYTSDGYDKEKRMPKELYVTKNGITVRYFKNIHNQLAYVYNLFLTPGLYLKALQEVPKQDCIHIHDFYTLQNFWIGILARIFKIPYILSVHGCLEEVRMGQRSVFKQLFYSLYGKQLLHHAAVVIATSENEKADYLKHGVTKEKITMLGHGVSATEFQTKVTKEVAKKKLKLKTSQPLVTFLGRIHAVKGLDLLVEAVALLKDESFSVVIAGSDDGYLEELKNRITNLGIAKKITLLPACFGEQKALLFKASDVFVYPSYSEGFSLGILEAAAVGLPLVLTEGCHFPEVTVQKAGLVVAPNPAKIAKAIRDLLQDTKKRTLFGTNAAAFVEKKYSMEAIGNRLLDIYAQVI